MDQVVPKYIDGPFGRATFIRSLDPMVVAGMYMAQYKIDIRDSFAGIQEINLYQCDTTGFMFWSPSDVAGDEDFYHRVSAAWPTYYREWRWEYGQLNDTFDTGSRVLEVGCGRGYFLKSLEGKVKHAQGVEFNTQAIANKVTKWDVEAISLADAASRYGEAFDVVCHFQVLEHVTRPREFLADSARLLVPGGRLAFSVPNFEYVNHANGRDAFDLPPHHVNHITPKSLASIAVHLGLDVVRVQTMPRFFTAEAVHPAVEQSFTYKVARKIAYHLFNFAYRRHSEPGHTMVAVFRKPVRTP